MHTPRMPRPSLLLLSCLLLVGCEAAAPVAPRTGNPPLDADGASAATLEFRGQRPCVDCAGIDALLRLQSGNGAQRYRLVERYRSAQGDQSFNEEGEWVASGDLLRLRSSEGGERVYLRMDDGSLQARGIDGAILSALADDVLLPVNFDVDR